MFSTSNTATRDEFDHIRDQLYNYKNNASRECLDQQGSNKVSMNSVLSDLRVFPLNNEEKRNNSTFPAYCNLLNFSGEKYLLPSQFSSEDRSNRMELSNDGRIVKYIGPGRNDSDAAAVRSNLPIPPQIGIYYYEATVVNKGRDGYISLGFAIKSSSLSRLTGWEPGTVGYHADDGNLYRGAGTGASFGPSYTTGDTIGCGINYRDKAFFFTKNGVLVGEVTNLRDKFHLPFFPCVGCRTPGEIVSVNFGMDGNVSFSFDIVSYVERKQVTNIESSGLKDSNLSQQQMQEKLILSYLIHCGYQKTAFAFFKRINGNNNAKLPDSDDSMNDDRADGELSAAFSAAQTRRSIVEAVHNGNMLSAMTELLNNYPNFLNENFEMSFQLDCLSFIELVKQFRWESQQGNGPNSGYEALIKAGQKLYNAFPSTLEQSNNAQLLQDALSLIAYIDPGQSPVSYLLDKSFRKNVAVKLDEALLIAEGKPIVSQLHRVLQQGQVCLNELQDLEDSAVALINV